MTWEYKGRKASQVPRKKRPERVEEILEKSRERGDSQAVRQMFRKLSNKTKKTPVKKRPTSKSPKFRISM
jgi:hypothetical protein